jgi:molecular chaperone IbpA
MTTFDFSPLYRTSVGFDRLASMLASAKRHEQGGGYPPYNIISSSENQYRITMAVAGFTEADLNINTEKNILTISGKGPEESDDQEYLYRGIANRSFERRFNLDSHVRVVGASLANGLLHIELERELPEAMKPRTIEIQPASRVLEAEETDKAA